jgi:hypothetical protein
VIWSVLHSKEYIYFTMIFCGYSKLPHKVILNILNIVLVFTSEEHYANHAHNGGYLCFRSFVS